MLHTILFIFQILGILLLVILVLLLLFVSAVLFVPVTCRIQAKLRGSVHVSLTGGWLFRLLTVHYVLDGPGEWKQDLRVCFLGFPIRKPFKKRKRPKRRETEKETGKRQEKKAASGLEEASLPPEKPRGAESGKKDQEGKKGQQKKQKRSPWIRIKSVYFGLVRAVRWIFDTMRGIWEAVCNIPERVRAVLERKDALFEFWGLPEHRRARSAVWKEAVYLLKKLRPKKAEGYVRFGFDDPAATGLTMGALSASCLWLPEKLRLIPVFDRRVLESELLIKGKIRLYVLARILRRIYFNRDIRHMYRSWKEL